MEEQSPYSADNRYKDEHAAICHDLISVFKKKNEGYGDSFGRTFRQWGLISAVVRITDKFHRLESLTQKNGLYDEIEDTLLDMANYCIMTLAQVRIMRDSIKEEGFGSDGHEGLHGSPRCDEKIRCEPSNCSCLD